MRLLSGRPQSDTDIAGLEPIAAPNFSAMYEANAVELVIICPSI